MEKFISIIIPAYNAAPHISRILDCLLNSERQKVVNGKEIRETLPSGFWDEIELIIVNDGSTDNTPEIINEYAEKYDFIKIITQDNQGSSVARNAGFNVSIGKYVWYMDSDDALHPTALYYVYEILRREQPDILHYQVRRFNSGFRDSDLQNMYNEDVISNAKVHREDSLEFLKKTNLVRYEKAAVWSYIVIREARGNHLFKSNFYDEDDRPFNIPLILSLESVLVTEAQLYYYLYAPNSILNCRDISHLRKRNKYLIDIIDGYKELKKNPKIQQHKELKEILDGIVADRLYRYVSNLVKLDYTDAEVKEAIGVLEKRGEYPLKRFVSHEGSVNGKPIFHRMIFNIIRWKPGLWLMRKLLRK